jgi:hypothetical protein
MGVAVTFRAQTENDRREHKSRHSFFLGGEEESLPETIDLEAPVFFQLAKLFCINS